VIVCEQGAFRFKSLNLGFSDAQADFLVRAFDKDASDSVE